MPKRIITILCLFVLLAPAWCCAKSYLVLLADDERGGLRLFSGRQIPANAANRLKSEFRARIDWDTVPVEQRPNPVSRYITQGYELIIGLGPNVSETVYTSAINNQRYRYALVDTGRGNLPENSTGIAFAYAEAGYVAGYTAALSSQTGTIGLVAGERISQISDFARGFNDGAKAAKSNVKIRNVYLGDFFDAYAARNKATEMFRNGADVVCHAAGPGGQGVIEAAQNYNLWAIALEPAQTSLPANVLAAVVLDYDRAVYEVCARAEENRFTGGRALGYNFNNRGLAFNAGPKLTGATGNQIKRLINDITHGKVTVRNAGGKPVN